MNKRSAINGFLSLVGSELASMDYTKAGQDGFVKSICPGVDSILRIEFVGTSRFDAVIYYGVRIDAVEHVLDSMTYFASFPVSISKRGQTFFQRLDVIRKLISPERLDIGYQVEDIDSADCSRIKFLVDAILLFEDVFTKCTPLCSYVSLDKSLPLGHHAFRIPVLLKLCKRNEYLSIYSDYVLSTGFIPDYGRFLAELEQLSI